MSTHLHGVEHRPWYIVDDLVAEYRTRLKRGDGDYEMLRSLKIIRSIVSIVAISILAMHVLGLGADPMTVFIFSVALIGTLSGVDVVDYLALVQAHREQKAENERDGGEDGDGDDGDD